MGEGEGVRVRGCGCSYSCDFTPQIASQMISDHLKTKVLLRSMLQTASPKNSKHEGTD